MSKICDECGFAAEEGSGQLCDICSGRADAQVEHDRLETNLIIAVEALTKISSGEWARDIANNALRQMDIKSQTTPIYTVNAEYGRLAQMCEEAFEGGWGSGASSPNLAWLLSSFKRKLDETGLRSHDGLVRACKEAFIDGRAWRAYVGGAGSLQGCWQHSDTKRKLDELLMGKK